VTLQPIAEECFINGNKIKKATKLSQGAVILLGKTNMFRFNHPAEAAKLRQKYASMENLSSIVPSRELESSSYLFYNAGSVSLEAALSVQHSQFKFSIS